MSIMNFIKGLMLIPLPYSLFSSLGLDLHGIIFIKHLANSLQFLWSHGHAHIRPLKVGDGCVLVPLPNYFEKLF